MDNIQFDLDKCQIVDISEVRENTWNPKKVKGKGYKEVVQSIKNRGLFYPIMVRENPNETSTYEILDGAHRFNACRDLGYDKILIYNFGPMDEAKAKSYTIYFETHVDINKSMFEDLLIELKDQIDLPYSIDFIENLEFKEDKTDIPPESHDRVDYVPDYCFAGLTQDEFDFISDSIDKIMETEMIGTEKEVLLKLIRNYQNPEKNA